MLGVSEAAGRMKIAVLGAGVAGLSAAWLLSRRHDVTLYERDDRMGGHANTVNVRGSRGDTPVDTGFIVYNEANYPNLTALFHHLGASTKPSNMSFAVSLGAGKVEYSSVDLAGFVNQGRNLFRPRFWSMTSDLLRFYKSAVADIPDEGSMTLGDYLDARGYGQAFQREHLLPQAAAIWSATLDEIRSYPACAFIRFFDNHGLFKIGRGRPEWRTVAGGSRSYVALMLDDMKARVRVGCGGVEVRRAGEHVLVCDARGDVETFDHVVIGAHADQALAMLSDPSAEEHETLGAFRYSRNQAVLHSDASLMPKQRALWASWNYTSDSDDGARCAVTYWMNLLQNLGGERDLFLTLNPERPIREESVAWRGEYEHPLFDPNALRAQRSLWRLQGARRTWFCGAYFGAGFHEDGLQAGLAVAEHLGGVRRPWIVPKESGRITLAPAPSTARVGVAA